MTTVWRWCRACPLAIVLLLAGCSDRQVVSEVGLPSPEKEPLRSLLDMGDISFYGKGSAAPTFDPAEIEPFAGSFGGMVVNVRWDQLQPDGPTKLAADNPIDQALRQVAAFNEAHPNAQIGVKLRVYGGFTAPIWAQMIGGPPIAADIQHGRVGTVGRWWEPEYIAAWRDLQTMLASAYDGNALVREVAVTSCAAATDEPFVSFDASGIGALQAAGYTDELQESCLTGAITDYEPWTATPIDFTFNPFHRYDSGKTVIDPMFTNMVMALCASSPHCILSNHTLNDPLRSADSAVYDKMQALYSVAPLRTTVDFQTAAPCQLDWCGAITNAVTLHASSVELWPGPVLGGGFTTLTSAQVVNLAEALSSGKMPVAGACPPPPPGCASSS
jgi:hypothetical protein